jgi:hypothetical protein
MAQDRYSNKLIQDLIQGKRCKVICLCASGDEKRAVVKKISTVSKYSSDPSKYYDKKHSRYRLCNFRKRWTWHMRYWDSNFIRPRLNYIFCMTIIEKYWRKTSTATWIIRNSKRISNLFCRIWLILRTCGFLRTYIHRIGFVVRHILSVWRTLETRKHQNIEIQYTQITSRSAQQYNTHKK